MNSTTLKKIFESNYKDFFAQHNVVISLPFCINWAGDIGLGYKGLSVRQKIPLRMYVGVKRVNKPGIRIGQVFYFDMLQDCFLQSDASNYAPYFGDVSNYLHNHFADWLVSGEGIEITIFSECSRVLGLGFNSIFSLGVVSSLYVYTRKLTTEKCKKIQNVSINEAMNNTLLPTKDIFYHAAQIDCVVSGRVSFGYKVASFFDSGYPVVACKIDYQNEKIGHKLGFGMRLNEIWTDLDQQVYTPFDIGVLYPSKPVIAEHLLKHIESNYQRFDGCKKDLQQAMGYLFDTVLPFQKPKFYKYFIENDCKVDDVYGKVMGMVSLEVLYHLSLIYKKDFSSYNWDTFFDALEKMRYGNIMSRKSSSDFCFFMNNLIAQVGGDIALMPNDTTIMGGTVTFVAPLEKKRQQLLSCLHTKSQSYLSTFLVYAHWVDGIEYDGIKIEQDILAEHYATLMKKNTCVLVKHDGSTIIGEYEHLVKHGDLDLICDTLYGKMYTKGKKLTSQDIHSQNTTVDILSQLLLSANKELSNKHFSLSSYTKNKNEMVSKIILPLKKFIAREFGKTVMIECSGSLSHFTIRLFDYHDVKIGIIKDINMLRNEKIL